MKENYVSFGTAVLLKEKGFDEKCWKVYMQGELKSASCCMEGESCVDNDDIKAAANYEGWIEYTQGYYAVLAPTLQRVLEWLIEEKEILVSINPTIDKDGIVCVMYYIWRLDDINEEAVKSGLYSVDGYIECIDDGIKYCLENLV